MKEIFCARVDELLSKGIPSVFAVPNASYPIQQAALAMPATAFTWQLHVSGLLHANQNGFDLKILNNKHSTLSIISNASTQS